MKEKPKKERMLLGEQILGLIFQNMILKGKFDIEVFELFVITNKMNTALKDAGNTTITFDLASIVSFVEWFDYIFMFKENKVSLTDEQIADIVHDFNNAKELAKKMPDGIFEDVKPILTKVVDDYFQEDGFGHLLDVAINSIVNENITVKEKQRRLMLVRNEVKELKKSLSERVDDAFLSVVIGYKYCHECDEYYKEETWKEKSGMRTVDIKGEIKLIRENYEICPAGHKILTKVEECK